jgi:hypothetical protein
MIKRGILLEDHDHVVDRCSLRERSRERAAQQKDGKRIFRFQSRASLDDQVFDRHAWMTWLSREIFPQVRKP